MDSKSQTSGQQDGHPSRREFLTRAGCMAGGIALFGIPGLKPSLSDAALKSGSTGGIFALELDGQIVEALRAMQGGFPKADVISVPAGPSAADKKQNGPPKFQEIAIECNPVMPKPIFDWVSSSLNMTPLRKSGAIITADFNRKEQSRLQFNNAIITEIGFPAFDGASRDAGFLTIKFAPESTTPLGGKGTDLSGPLNQKTQRALSSNFRLTIPGLDCSNVSKIEAFTVKQKVVQDEFGKTRVPLKEPGKLEFPNLSISVAESSAGTFYAWFQDMVLKGKVGDENERPGTLELLDQSMKTTLLTINFHHLGIFGFAPESADSAAEKIRRVKVEMYCEQITLTPGKV
jgi:hypothetical protein